jgi:hypothetical protein
MEFYFSLEMFATATMFGTMVLVFGWWFASGDLRARIWRIVINTSFSYIIAFFIVSPYIYYFFAVRFKHTPFWPVSSLSADLLNFVIPTRLNAMGRISAFESISGRFNMGIIAEEVGFLNWPLVLMAVLYARHYHREPIGQLLVDSIAVILVCALGPSLIIAGHVFRVGLPWMVVQLPVLNNIAPVRLLIYAYLTIAVMVSFWLTHLLQEKPLR